MPTSLKQPHSPVPHGSDSPALTPRSLATSEQYILVEKRLYTAHEIYISARRITQLFTLIVSPHPRLRKPKRHICIVCPAKTSSHTQKSLDNKTQTENTTIITIAASCPPSAPIPGRYTTKCPARGYLAGQPTSTRPHTAPSPTTRPYASLPVPRAVPTPR